MRIAHVIDYFHTDVGYQEYYLAKCMAESGHTVRVVTSPYRQHTVAVPGPDEEAGADALEVAGVEVVRLPARQLGHDRAWLKGLRASLSGFRPDAVHCHGPFAPTAVRVGRAKSKVDFTLLVDNHIQADIAPAASSAAGRFAYGSYRAVAGALLRQSVDHWVAIGPYERQFLAARLGLKLEEVKMIPLGFDPEIFGHDAERRRLLRDERGWTEDTVVAVTGKLNARKRPDLVAAACAEALEQGKPVRMVVAGSVDADARREIDARAKSLTSDGRLEYLPMLGRLDLADLYRCADVVVFARLPSISIYEAAGTGARVLVGRDEFSEWLNSKLPAIEPVDPYDLLGRLTPFEDRAERADQARRAFSWAGLSDIFVDLYGAPN